MTGINRDHEKRALTLLGRIVVVNDERVFFPSAVDFDDPSYTEITGKEITEFFRVAESEEVLKAKLETLDEVRMKFGKSYSVIDYQVIK